MQIGRFRSSTIAGMVVAVLGSAVLLLLDGDLDLSGRYTILQAVCYAPDRTAYEIRRTDNQTLNGPRYAVLISEHTPTDLDMKHALISFWRHGSFSLAEPSIVMKWAGPNVLTLTTTDAGTNPDWVLKQHKQLGDVAIQYAGQP